MTKWPHITQSNYAAQFLANCSSIHPQPQYAHRSRHTQTMEDLYDYGKAKMQQFHFADALVLFTRCEAFLEKKGVRSCEYRNLAQYMFKCSQHEALACAGMGMDTPAESRARSLLKQTLPGVGDRIHKAYAHALVRVGLDDRRTFQAMDAHELVDLLVNACAWKRGHALVFAQAHGRRMKEQRELCEAVVEQLLRLIGALRDVGSSAK